MTPERLIHMEISGKEVPRSAQEVQKENWGGLMCESINTLGYFPELRVGETTQRDGDLLGKPPSAGLKCRIFRGWGHFSCRKVDMEPSLFVWLGPLSTFLHQ